MEVRVEIFHLLRPFYETRVFVEFTGNWVGMEVRVGKKKEFFIYEEPLIYKALRYVFLL